MTGWGPWTLLIIGAAWIGVLHWTRSFVCPRCRRAFATGNAFPFNEYCGACGTPQFAPPHLFGPFSTGTRDVVSRPASPPGRELSLRARRIIGGAQAFAGALVLAFVRTPRNDAVLGTWQEWSRVGFAVLAMIGGLALYRGNRSGYSITRLVLASQVVSFVAPGVAYEVSAGFFAGLKLSSVQVGVSAGWNSGFMFWLGPTTGWMFNLNLFSLGLFSFIPPSPSQSVPPEGAT